MGLEQYRYGGSRYLQGNHLDLHHKSSEYLSLLSFKEPSSACEPCPPRGDMTTSIAATPENAPTAAVKPASEKTFPVSRITLP